MNHFEYTEHTGKRVELPSGQFRWEPTGSVTHKYDWEVKEDKIIVNGKWMKIEFDFQLSYGLRKTKIKSWNLDEELSKFTKEKFWNHDAHIILSWVVEHGKEVQI